MNQSTELVYSGRAGGSRSVEVVAQPTISACLMTQTIFSMLLELRDTTLFMEWNEPISGQPFLNVHAHNVPCAVCMAVSRCSMLMIPAKTQCPTSWTTEYVGYLISEAHDYALPTTYECVDKDPESVPGLNGVGWGSGSVIFNHVEASCNGMACPPYDREKELTCVVCTR